MPMDRRKGKLVGGTSDWIILKHKSLNGKKNGLWDLVWEFMGNTCYLEDCSRLGQCVLNEIDSRCSHTLTQLVENGDMILWDENTLATNLLAQSHPNFCFFAGPK